MKNRLMKSLAAALCLAVAGTPVSAQLTAAAGAISFTPGVRLASPQISEFHELIGGMLDAHFDARTPVLSAIESFSRAENQGDRMAAMPMAEQAAAGLIAEVLSAPQNAQALLSRVDMPSASRRRLLAVAKQVQAEGASARMTEALSAMRRQVMPGERIALPRRAESRVQTLLRRFRGAQSRFESFDERGYSPSGGRGGGGGNERIEEPVLETSAYVQDRTPSSKKIANLKLLAEKDPVAARAAAMQILRSPDERRVEVRITALRMLGDGKSAEILPLLLDLVDNDFNWYIRREAARSVGARAADLGELKARAEKTMRGLYKSNLSALRLMAADVLKKMGVEPGPEPFMSEPGRMNLVPLPTGLARQIMRAPDDDGSKKPNQGWRSWKRAAFFAALLAAGWLLLSQQQGAQTPTSRPAIQASMIAAPADSSAADPVKSNETAAKAEAKSDSVDAAKPVEQPVAPRVRTGEEALNDIADNTKVSADAAKRAAQAQEVDLMLKMAAMKGSAQSGGGGLLGMILNVVFQTAIWVLAWMGISWLIGKLLSRRGGGGINNNPGINLSGGVKDKAERPTEKFEDVAGIDDAMIEIQEIAEFLRDPSRYARMGASIPRGVLLEGPPGTGKTLLAKALAGSTNSAFISMAGSEFVELYVGVGAARVRELFRKAASQAPAIIFIDEIDAVGQSRDTGPGNHQEARQTINQLLQEMEGIDSAKGVVVIAATNRAQDLDPALKRPGRFDRTIYVGQPDLLGREAILQVHSASRRLAAEVDLRFIAQRTAGLSGAFLKGIVNEAAILATRSGADAIGMAHFNEAVDRMTIGQKRNLFIPRELKTRVAEHEVGHLVAGLFTPTGKVPNKVTIIPHGSGALGFAERGSEEDSDKFLYTQPELEDGIVMSAGGMAAEEEIYGNISTGPGSDLENATRVARAMVEKLAMSKKVGPIVVGDARGYSGNRGISENLAQTIDQEVVRIITEAKERAAKILAEHKELRKALVAALMEKETLTRDEIIEIVRRVEPNGKFAGN